MRRYFVRLPDDDLAFLPQGEPEFTNYIRDLTWAQRFAFLNREEMMDRVLAMLRRHVGPFEEEERINCHHNFAQREHHFGKDIWVTRKGAISAKRGELGLIPGSMATASYIVSGLGNEMAFASSPHGAGRRFSRREARRRFTVDDLATAMEGIECRVDEAFVDEIPAAYRDIDQVMADAESLVRVEHTLRQVVNVKGK
jgi:tRNA-splicing ligase RtcB